MPQTTTEVLLTIFIIAMGTFLTRVLPFLLFPSHKKTPLFITYLGKVLLFSIIGMLIVYCFQSVSPFSWPHGFLNWPLPFLSFLFTNGSTICSSV
jgi:branched-subunit amino acid transport protein AzlD